MAAAVVVAQAEGATSAEKVSGLSSSVSSTADGEKAHADGHWAKDCPQGGSAGGGGGRGGAGGGGGGSNYTCFKVRYPRTFCLLLTMADRERFRRPFSVRRRYGFLSLANVCSPSTHMRRFSAEGHFSNACPNDAGPSRGSSSRGGRGGGGARRGGTTTRGRGGKRYS